jgi:hypothetical protein
MTKTLLALGLAAASLTFAQTVATPAAGSNPAPTSKSTPKTTKKHVKKHKKAPAATATKPAAAPSK